MNQHNNSLGNCSTNGSPLNSDNNNLSIIKHGKQAPYHDASLIIESHGGLDRMRSTLQKLKGWCDEQRKLGRKPGKGFMKSLNTWISVYENSVKGNIGLPTSMDSVTTMVDAPRDIPTMPLQGFQLLKRKCYIVKLANSGTTAGGFYAELRTGDLNPYVSNITVVFRISKISSWTVNPAGGANTGFAGCAISTQSGSSSTDSIMPMWCENWTPIGQGYSGITSTYPAGDFPYYADNVDLGIISHFTSIGGTGGVSGIPVVFHVTIEYMV